MIKVELFRPVGDTSTLRLNSIGAVAATYSTRSATTSKTTMTATTELSVPRYSQMIHKGQFTQWGGGGSSWCSPTSVSMVRRIYYRGQFEKPGSVAAGVFRTSSVRPANRSRGIQPAGRRDRRRDVSLRHCDEGPVVAGCTVGENINAFGGLRGSG